MQLEPMLAELEKRGSEMGDTECRVHVAAEAITKVAGMGRTVKKRKSARC